MLGLLFGVIVRPHVITAAGIRVRNGSEVDIPIAWKDVHSITRRNHTNNGKQPRVTSDENGEASLHMRIQNQYRDPTQPARLVTTSSSHRPGFAPVRVMPAGSSHH